MADKWLRIDGELHRKIKLVAALQGTSIRAVVNERLQQTVDEALRETVLPDLRAQKDRPGEQAPAEKEPAPCPNTS